MNPALVQGRAAFARRAWSEAYESLRAADAIALLDAEDLDRLATAAFLIGDDDTSVAARTRAYAAFAEAGQTKAAALAAFWLSFALLDKASSRAQAAGWLARAQRLLEGVDGDCVERGFVLCGSARQLAAVSGDAAAAHAAFTEAAEIGVRLGDRDLIALGRHGQGRTLLMMKQIAAGLALLDETMVAVTAGEVGPLVSGAVYCSVITACHDIFDIERANEWTTALNRWCATQPDIVPFRGYCLIRRSELMQLHGDWPEALSEARNACERLAVGSQPEAGSAFYQLGEMHRLRGEFEEADEAYRKANQAGKKPQPGLALLRLSEGKSDLADGAIRLALQETRMPGARVPVLAAAVDIFLGTNDVGAAVAASNELAEFAERLGSPYVRALSLTAAGSIGLARGDALGALESLRNACEIWQKLGAPYECARTRVAIGLAYRNMGDAEGGELEFDAAEDVFEKLGAAGDASRVRALRPAGAPAAASGLTGREIEVLRLIATGATNRAIAGRLVISEKTVARHVSNIFTKLDLSSRAAATAYAYDHKLL
jgi:DNA-binding CsgD family transcriptional regulator